MTGAVTQNTPDRADAGRTTTIQVEIFGSSYGVRSDREPEHLEALAALVDRKMREIAGQTVAVETSRIAILAALNLADELVRQRGQGGADGVQSATKANGLLDELERALKAPSQ